MTTQDDNFDLWRYKEMKKYFNLDKNPPLEASTVACFYAGITSATEYFKTEIAELKEMHEHLKAETIKETNKLCNEITKWKEGKL